MSAGLRIEGRAIRLGDDVSTDQIYPGRFLFELEPEAQARHALAGIDEGLAARLPDAPVIAAGWNFGCGSSREQAATALRGAGARLVIAASFGRIYLRNCINTGLPAIESPGLAAAIAEGDAVRADLAAGEAWVRGERHAFAPLPAALIEILAEGGLLPRLKRFAQAQA